MTREEEFILENQAKMFSLLAVLLAQSNDETVKKFAAMAQQSAELVREQIDRWKE